MTKLTETLPSGKTIVRTVDELGRPVEEVHSYGLLDIACQMTFAEGEKVEELYFVKRRLVGRPRYEKARLDFLDMPAADATLKDLGRELASLARKECKQRAAANRRRRAYPPSGEQQELAARQSAFFQAIGRDDLIALGELLDAGADPNWRVVVSGVESGHTPLHLACVAESLAVVVLLIERGADPNLKFEYHSPIDGRVERGLSALMFARSVKVAEALLEAGAAIDDMDANGMTPLMRAAQRGSLDVVRLMLKAGATTHTRDLNGHSAADLAADNSEYFRQHAADFKEGHADRRIREFEEIRRLVTA